MLAVNGYAQSRATFGNVSYAVPRGWTQRDTAADNVEGVHFANLGFSVAGRDCHMLLFGTIKSLGKQELDFRSEWKALAAKILHRPEAEFEPFNPSKGLHGLVGGGEDGKARLFLFVLNAGNQVAPLISLCQVGVPATQLLLASEYAQLLRVNGPSQPTSGFSSATERPSSTSAGDPSTKTIFVLDDLVGEWTSGSTSSTAYVNRYTGTYAGSTVLAAGIRRLINADGSYTQVLNGINNGQILHGDNSGSVKIEGGQIIFTAKVAHESESFYLIRSQAAPDGSTVLTVYPSYWASKGFTQQTIQQFGQQWTRVATKRQN
jgi:hypothetical protein